MFKHGESLTDWVNKNAADGKDSQITTPPRLQGRMLSEVEKDASQWIADNMPLYAVGSENIAPKSVTPDALNLGISEYTTSNVTTTRDIDVSTATLADVANTLATLIEDLKDSGVIG